VNAAKTIWIKGENDTTNQIYQPIKIFFSFIKKSYHRMNNHDTELNWRQDELFLTKAVQINTSS